MARFLPGRGLYAVTPLSLTNANALLDAVQAAIRGGAVMIQYRAKSHVTAEVGLELRELCRKASVPFIVNDDPHLAFKVRADGVHVGRNDPSLAAARALLGNDAIIGSSCYNDFTAAEAAVRAGADYVAFGSFFHSKTKPGALRAATELLQRARTLFTVPIVAIGGITPDNGMALIAAGAHLLAVSHGVFGQPDPEAAARRYAALFV